MKVVVGLGNPGKRYENTPHNMGFRVIAELAERGASRLKRSLRFRSRICKTRIADEDLLLVQPLTFMNVSGVAVGRILRYYKVALADLLVAVDDADLVLGRMRIRSKGGSGGHRGLASIIENVGGDVFTRVRLGIGRDRGGRALVDHVLTTFSSEEEEQAGIVTGEAVEAVDLILEKGVEAAMNHFNGSRLDQV